ncbi:MAG: electron transport complex subunit E [Oscillospiraceae bacterium]|nr:electron transport complex subunit E [Oscillospiraceae bacterium]
MKIKDLFLDGVIRKNPVLVQLLGMCSALAITTSLFNGLGMGLAVTIILICSNVVISLLRNFIPKKIRIAAFIVVIAAFVTIVDLLIQAFIPDLSESLGVFIPLIVVNCIILGRAEALASKNKVGVAALDGLFQGIGYTIAAVAMCIVRELLGSGTFGGGILNGGAGIRIFPEQFGATYMIMPFGGFIVMAFLIALTQWLVARNEKKTGKKADPVPDEYEEVLK